MSETAQTIFVVVAILSALGYLIARARKKGSCGKGCGCDAKKPAEKNA